MPTVNSASIIRKAQAALNAGVKANEIRKSLEFKANKAAKDIRDVLEANFESHPVTKELRSSSGNTSKFLSYGNIQAYFGLSDNKIDTDLSIMKGIIGDYKVSVIKVPQTSQYKINILFPKIDRYYDATPPPEESYRTSWVKALEYGLVQNFANFLFRKRGFPSVGSRSNTGIQVNAVIHRGALNTVPAIPFITEIYKKVLGNKVFIRDILTSVRIR